jgi:hypothetical protein
MLRKSLIAKQLLEVLENSNREQTCFSWPEMLETKVFRVTMQSV